MLALCDVISQRSHQTYEVEVRASESVIMLMTETDHRLKYTFNSGFFKHFSLSCCSNILPYNEQLTFRSYHLMLVRLSKGP